MEYTGLHKCRGRQPAGKKQNITLVIQDYIFVLFKCGDNLNIYIDFRTPEIIRS